MSLFGNTNEENTNTVNTTVKLINLAERNILPELMKNIKTGAVLIINTTPLKNRTDEMKAEEYISGYADALEGSMTKIADHMLLVGDDKLAVEREAHKQLGEQNNDLDEPEINQVASDNTNENDK